MVVSLGPWPTAAQALVLAQARISEKLPPPTRAAVLMALLGIVLLGMLIVAIILLGGHWVRRQGSVRRGSPVPPDRAPLYQSTKPVENQGSPTASSRDGEDDGDQLRDTQADYGETKSS